MEEFYFMLFSEKKTDFLIDRLKKQINSVKCSNLLPVLQIRTIKGLSSKPIITKFSNKSLIFPDKIEEIKGEDFFLLISQWWNEKDLEKSGFVPLKSILDLLVEKGISENHVESKKLLINSSKSVYKNDFFGIFTKSILKYQITELSKKVNAHERESFFLPISQKLSSIKRKLLIQRISPELKGKNNEGEGVINGLVRFQRYLRSVTPSLNR